MRPMSRIQALLQICEADPDIPVKSDFYDFINKRFGGNLLGAELAKGVSSDVPEVLHGPQMSFHDGTVYSFNEDLIGSKARPGFSPKLQGESLETNPTQSLKDYEVSNTDSIPLRIYRQMSNDSTITIATIIVQGIISGLKYHISALDPIVQSVVDQAYKKTHADIVRNLVRTGFQDGFCFGEKIWERETFTVNKINENGESEVLYQGVGVSLSRVKWIDPSAQIKFFKSKKTGQLVHLEQQQQGKTIKVPANKIVWFALDKQYDNIFGRSRYKAAYPYWYNTKIGQQWSLRHLERTGEPILIGRHPSGTSLVRTDPTKPESVIANSSIMLNLLRGMKSGSRVTLSSDRDKESKEYVWDVEYVEPKESHIDSFLKWEDQNEHKKLAALGVFASLVLPGSNFSDADAKLDLLISILEDLVSQIEKAIRSDVIDQAISYNFGPEYINQVDFSIDRGGLGRRNILKEVLNTTLRMSASQDGRYLIQWPDIQAMLKELGIPSAPFKNQFTEDSSVKLKGQTPLQEMEEDRQSNDVASGTRQPDTRERERPAKASNATEIT